MQVDKGFKVGDVVEVIHVKTTRVTSLLGKTFVITQHDVDVFNGRIPSSAVKGEVYLFDENKYGVNFTLDMLKLVQSKQEQYYTSIPTDVKNGDKFEIISKTGYKDRFEWAGDKDFPLGEIVTLNYSRPTHEPHFINSKGEKTYLNWGCVKPVKKTLISKNTTSTDIKQYPLTPDEMIKPKVGDKVLLKKGSGWNYFGRMDKYDGTIQQIESTDGLHFHIVDDPVWCFEYSDIVKIITDDISESYEFKVGDEVELISQTGISTSFKIGDKGFIVGHDSQDNTYSLKINGYTQWVKPKQIKLVNLINTTTNGKVHSNTESTFIFAITPTISTTTIRGGTSICSSGKEITLGS